MSSGEDRESKDPACEEALEEARRQERLRREAERRRRRQPPSVEPGVDTPPRRRGEPQLEDRD